jgi:GxxExxY protein
VNLEALAKQVVGCGFQVHTDLGPGLLESVYEVVLAKYLVKRGFQVERQTPISFTLDGSTFEGAFRVDLLVENVLVLEIKSLERTLPVHNKQLLTYLRLMKLQLGFLMNFGAASFKDGIHRLANDYWRDDSAPARSAL